MNRTLCNVLMFATGAAIGSLVTWKLVKDKYERIAQEEIDSVKQTWGRLGSEKREDTELCNDCDDEEVCEDDDDSEMTEYHAIARNYRMSDDDTADCEKGEGDSVPYVNGPIVIPPEDFADGNYDHELHCLTYYSDGVLSNDWYEKLDIEETIGEESLEHFGDYTEDVVHVRNERKQADYEVTRDPRRYADVILDDPLMNKYAT